MTGRFPKLLVIILCSTILLVPPASAGFLDFLFGTPPPTQAPATGTGIPAPQALGGTDLSTVISLLQAINERISLVAENTRPEAKGLVTGNIVLFDSNGNSGNALPSGTALIALPQGKCDVAIFARSVGMFITLEEEKDMEIERERYYRNRQTCLNDPMCRKTVQLDNEFPFLYIEYKPYDSRNTLSQVTLAYRCQPV